MGKGGCKAVSTCQGCQGRNIYTFSFQKTVILLPMPWFLPIVGFGSPYSHIFQSIPINSNIRLLFRILYVANFAYGTQKKYTGIWGRVILPWRLSRSSYTPWGRLQDISVSTDAPSTHMSPIGRNRCLTSYLKETAESSFSVRHLSNTSWTAFRRRAENGKTHRVADSPTGQTGIEWMEIAMLVMFGIQLRLYHGKSRRDFPFSAAVESSTASSHTWVLISSMSSMVLRYLAGETSPLFSIHSHA